MDNLFFLEAICKQTKKTFYMRFDKAAGNIWCRTYGVEHMSSGVNAKVNRLANIDISKATVGPQYKCPYCGNRSGVKCGHCGKINCAPRDSDNFECAFCGHKGTVGDDYIKMAKGNIGRGQ